MNVDSKSIQCLAFGFVISILGGLIGLGGAEFRIPILVMILAIPISYTIPINLFISIVTVVFSFLFRSLYLGPRMVIENIYVIFILTAGSMIGAYCGAGLSNKINVRILKKLISILLFYLSIILIASGAFGGGYKGLNFNTEEMVIMGFFSGVMIGAFSSLLGVAGGELIIPAIVMIFSLDIKIAGTLSLLISIPTISVGLYKHCRNADKVNYIRENIRIPLLFIAGSIPGAYIGSSLVMYFQSEVIKIILGFLLAFSSIRMLFD
jgi:uncharacterized membrane protein YfcA